MKTKANIYHHTHWDNEWYFTEEDSLIQLTYHMKELISALEQNVIDYFHLDGQTAILEDYLELHQEDKNRVKKLIEDKRLFVGPFLSQIDSFITSGESVVNNLRYGINYGNQYGGVCKVAYLPDSFGQSQDYPKIFNDLGIHSFIFRRGMGDEHSLPLDFIFQSNDGSQVICSTLYCGYGFATAPFLNKTLTGDAGLDYDGKDIKKQLLKLARLSTLEGEFLLPIGNDQTPVIWNFKELLNYYQNDNTYDFVEVTLSDYMEKLSKNKENLKIYQGEFINPQYHRVHRSIYSVRMDIKNLQDQLERLMALEIQPILTILNRIGLPYDEKIIGRIWNLLGRSQTHSGATNTDKTNDLILNRTAKAFNLAEALKVYLIRKVAVSLPKEHAPIVFFNTLPYQRDLVMELKVYTKSKKFSLQYNGNDLEYTLSSKEEVYGGVVRKNSQDHDPNLYYYESTVLVNIPKVPGFTYDTIYVNENTNYIPSSFEATECIENELYKIWFENNRLCVKNKTNGNVIEDFIQLEESGDEGDNYDYSYPSKDMQNFASFLENTVSCKTSKEKQVMYIKAQMNCPKDLASRANQILNNKDAIELEITLKKGSSIIGVKGVYRNHALNHRVRLVVHTPYQTTTSIAGTQFGYIERENNPSIMKNWKKEGWLEEPTPIYPLLNYVLLKENRDSVCVYTKSSKEYEIIGENYTDIACTLFRSIGYLGLPDLNRRPGRASGIAEKIIESPKSQMLGDNKFEIGISLVEGTDMNQVVTDYNLYAVQECYYQNQNLNKVVYPISYFQTNPLQNEIEDNYTLSIPNDLNRFAFSTLEMLDNHTILRIFNNGEACQTTDLLNKCDLLGGFKQKESQIRVGEIINVKVE